MVGDALENSVISDLVLLCCRVIDRWDGCGCEAAMSLTRQIILHLSPTPPTLLFYCLFNHTRI